MALISLRPRLDHAAGCAGQAAHIVPLALETMAQRYAQHGPAKKKAA